MQDYLYNIASLRMALLLTFANFPLSPPTDIDRLLVMDPFRFSDMMKNVNILTMLINDASVIVKKPSAYCLFVIWNNIVPIVLYVSNQFFI